MIKGEFAENLMNIDCWTSEEKEIIGNIYENKELLEG